MPKKKESTGYSFFVSFEGKEKKLDASSISECLYLLPNDLAKRTIRIVNGEKEHRILLYPRLAKRLRVNKLAVQLLEKRLKTIIG